MVLNNVDAFLPSRRGRFSVFLRLDSNQNLRQNRLISLNFVVTMCICVARCCSVAGLVELSGRAIFTPLAGRVLVSHSAQSVFRFELAVLSRDVALDCFTTARGES